jgi:hypothetical protein
LLLVSGSNWSAWVIVAVFACGLAESTLTVSISVADAPLRGFARVRVELVGGGERGRVRLRVGGDDAGPERQHCGCAEAESADVPEAGGRRVGALAGRRRDEGEPGGERVGYLRAVGRCRPVLVSVTVNVISSPTLGCALLTDLSRIRSACCRRCGSLSASGWDTESRVHVEWARPNGFGRALV